MPNPSNLLRAYHLPSSLVIWYGLVGSVFFMNTELIFEGLPLPPMKRNVLFMMKCLDCSIFLTPHPWSWYHCLFLLQSEAWGHSSGLASECHLGRKGVHRNWSRGVDYNHCKPKYECGMLTGGSAKD